MGICHDKVTTELRAQNYNVVRHPREGITPLQLVGKVGDAVNLLGGLDKLITNPPATLPPITPDLAAADLEGQQSDKQDIGIGLSFLGSVLSALSGGNLNIKAQYQRARRLQFTFNDVTTDTVEPLDVGNYLKRGTVDADNLVLQQFVLGNGQLFLITQTLKAKRITVSTEDDHGVAVALDVPVIRQLVSANLKVEASADQASEVTYSGTKSLVFGFQAFRVGVAGGALSLVPSAPGSIAFAAPSDAGAASVPRKPALLEQDGTLLEFSGADWEAEARTRVGGGANPAGRA